MTKKVLSFVEFVLESENVFEKEGGQGITEETIIKILDVQKKIATSKLPKGKKIEDLQPGQYLRTFIESRALYDELKPEDKKKLLESLLNKAKKYGIDAKDIDKRLEDYEDDKRLPQNPKIWVTKKETVIKTPEEKKEEEPKEKKFEFVDIIPDEDKGSVFQNNMYGYDEKKLKEIYLDEEKAKAIKNAIDLYVKKDYEGKGERIKSISISSSCSRYRNTDDAENLSWAELGFKRVQTFSDLFLLAAKKLGAEDEYIKKLQSRIKVDYLGSNGDGSSGPDPIQAEYKKVYYINENGKTVWKLKKGTDPLKIMVTDVQVKPEGPVLGKTAKLTDALDLNDEPIKKAPTSPSEYDQYRFVEVKIEAIPLDDDKVKPLPVEPEPTEPTEIKTSEYKFLVVLGKKPKGKSGGGSGTSIRLPSFRRHKPRKKRTRVDACPVFGLKSFNF